MKNRPRIELQWSASDMAIEVVGWAAVIGIWALAWVNFSALPDEIPIHYNAAGVADRFGGKTGLFTPIIVATVLFVGLTILNRFPHIFNYPTTITADNAQHQYTNATRMIRFLKMIIVVIFGMIVYQTIEYAHGNADGLGSYFLPMILGMVFLPLIYFLIRASKPK